MKVWMLTEAFTLTEDHTTIHESLSSWGLACTSRHIAMRRLRNAVHERIVEDLEGSDAGDEEIDSAVEEVMSEGVKLPKRGFRCGYSKDDREIVWRVYPCEVEPARAVKGRKAR